MSDSSTSKASFAGSILLPLALAQFICSYAGSNMSVAIGTMAGEA